MADFQAQVGAYDEEDVQIVALSADGEDGARAMKEEQEVAFPILYGLDVDEVRDAAGLYVEKGDKVHLQPAQFVLDPGGTVRLACYSSGKVGRLGAEETLDIIREQKEG